MHKKHSDNFKAKVALEAIKEEKTIAEIASAYQVHANMVTKWKKQAIENMASVFGNSSSKLQNEEAQNAEILSKIVSRQAIEIEWLKKKVL